MPSTLAATRPYPTDEDDIANLLHTVVGELQVVDQQLKVLSGKTRSAELLLARRFVAMAAEQAALIVERATFEARTAEMPLPRSAAD
ncbi:MAG TPA: hypothetical protein VGN05_08145 [Parvibaculum sp.]